MKLHEYALGIIAICLVSAVLGLAVYGFGMLFFVHR